MFGVLKWVGIHPPTYYSGCNLVLNAVKDAFDNLNNHCDLAVYIPKIMINGVDVQWRLFSDTILYAEKHNKGKIDRHYFRWQKIGRQIGFEFPCIFAERQAGQFTMRSSRKLCF